MSKIKIIEEKTDKNGNPMKVCSFEGGEKVFINSKYDTHLFGEVAVDKDYELIKDGQFFKIKMDKPMGEKPAWAGGIAKNMERKETSIGRSMDRKENSITLAGTARDATLIVVNLYPELVSVPDKEEAIKIVWEQWRTWLIEKSGDAKDISETKQPF